MRYRLVSDRTRSTTAAAIGVLLLAALLVALTSRPAAAVVFSNPGTITIPVSGAASPYPSTIGVSGCTRAVTDVNVTLAGFTHVLPYNAGVLLVGPQGQTVELKGYATGGTNGVASVNLTFDDEAGGSLPSPPVSGTYTPATTNFFNYFSPAPAGPYDTMLGVFDGTDPNGTWSLFVEDFFDSGGQIAGGWSLDIDCSGGLLPPPGGGGGAPSPTLTVTPAGYGSGTVTSSPPGISCPPDCSETIDSAADHPSDYSDVYVLTAHPASGSTFFGWFGACTGTQGPTCAVTVLYDDLFVAAWFDPSGSPPPPPPPPSPPPPPEPVTFDLHVTKAGKGRVTSDLEGINCGQTCDATYQEGESVTLTATPRSGWVLKRWKQGCSGSAPVCILEMSSDQNAKAVFVKLT